MSTEQEVLAAYAQDRYESARTMLSEFRGWARQLALKIAGAIGVLITIAALLLTVLVRHGALSAVILGLVAVWGAILLVFLGRLLHLYELAVKLGYEIVPFVTPRDVHELKAAIDAHPSGDSAIQLHSTLVVEYGRARRQRLAESNRVARALVAIRDRFIVTLFWGLFLTMGLAIAITCAAAASAGQP